MAKLAPYSNAIDNPLLFPAKTYPQKRATRTYTHFLNAVNALLADLTRSACEITSGLEYKFFCLTALRLTIPYSTP